MHVHLIQSGRPTFRHGIDPERQRSIEYLKRGVSTENREGKGNGKEGYGVLFVSTKRMADCAKPLHNEAGVRFT